MKAGLFHSFRRGQDGIAYLEFAIALPFLLALFMGAVEVTRYIIIAQKVEKATVTVTDLVAQSQTMSTAQLDILVTAVKQVMKPYSFDVNGYVIVSSVSKTGTSAPKVNWQYRGGGSWSQSSQIGISGATATLPNGFTLNDKDNVIIAEVFYNYYPLMAGSVLTNKMIYKVAVFKPRLGDVTTLQ